MSRQLSDLENILHQLVGEHAKLLKHLEAHQAAMKALDLRAMDDASKLQEGSRLRIQTLEVRRRILVDQLAITLKINERPTILLIAEAAPQSKKRLLALRDELKAGVTAVATRATIAGRLAGAVLGHLNTVVRLIAGAVDNSGVYTRDGVPRVAVRVGVIEAIG